MSKWDSYSVSVLYGTVLCCRGRGIWLLTHKAFMNTRKRTSCGARGGRSGTHGVGVRRLRLWTPPAATSVLAHMFPPSCIQPRLSRTSSAPTLSQHDSVFAVPGRTQVCLTCVVRPTRSPIDSSHHDVRLPRPASNLSKPPFTDMGMQAHRHSLCSCAWLRTGRWAWPRRGRTSMAQGSTW